VTFQRAEALAVCQGFRNSDVAGMIISKDHHFLAVHRGLLLAFAIIP
jgi:hypothetical protein